MAIRIRTKQSFDVPPRDVHTLVAILGELGFKEVSHTIPMVARRWSVNGGECVASLYHTGSLLIQDRWQGDGYRLLIHRLREVSS
jgi:hypothetical protein